MRPTRTIAALTLAVITIGTGITGTAGFTGGSGVAVRTSPPASSAALAMEANPETRAATPTATSPDPPRATPPMASRRAAPEEHTPPPAPLTPRPPADGRDAPDPFLLDDGNRWVLYSTQVGLANVPVATTPDLATWSASTDALPELPAWAEWGRTWAPGVLRRPGDFLLYFAARSRATGGQCIGAATSTSAIGPFISTSLEPLVCQPELGGSIDPHPFVDTDGAAYLLWKADGNAIGRPSTLFSQRLRSDGLALEGGPTALLHNDAAWEAPLVENPALVSIGGRYVLLYSGGWWESARYATGYATCDSPLGPCAKVTTERPLHANGAGVAGPGGACVITGPAGDLWLAHHGWTLGAVGYGSAGARSLHFTALQWDGTRLTLHGPPAARPTST